MSSADDAVDPGTARALATVQAILNELGWEPQRADGLAGFEVDFGPPHVPMASALAVVMGEGQQFVLYMNFGVVAPVDRRDECARLITHANAALIIGNFEMDYDDGLVRFRSGIDVTGVELAPQMVRNVIAQAVGAVETYADAISDVVLRGKSAAAALVDVEGADS